MEKQKTRYQKHGSLTTVGATPQKIYDLSIFTTEPSWVIPIKNHANKCISISQRHKTDFSLNLNRWFSIAAI